MKTDRSGKEAALCRNRPAGRAALPTGWFRILVCALLGCVSAEQAWSDAKAPAHTPAEWLAQVERVTAEEKRTESAERKAFLVSAGRALHPYSGGPDAIARRAPGSGRAKYEPFASWWAKEGKALFERWRGGAELTDSQKQHEWLLRAVMCWRYKSLRKRSRDKKAAFTPAEQAVKANMARVIKRGQQLLRKGYLGGSFTRAERDELRLYAIWIDIRCTGQGVLPFHLGLTPRRNGPPEVGKPAPPLTMMTFEAGLREPGYSDANPADPSDLLRPAILREFLQLTQGYERDPASPEDRPLVRARPLRIPPGREKDYERLSDSRGKRAVLLVLLSATDAWAWHGKILPMLEPVRQAYAGRIDVRLLNTTIHDTHMPVKDFLQDPPGRHDALHDFSLAERARACKMVYLDRPSLTMGYLLDDVQQRTRNTYRDQGGGAYLVLVDLDGKVAYADYHQHIPPHWGPKRVGFPAEFLTIRMNHLESRLAALAKAGYRYAKSMEGPYPPWRLKREGDQPPPNFGPRTREPTIWMCGRIQTIDAKAGTVTVLRNIADANAMKGLALWQAEQARATKAGRALQPYDPATKARLAAGRSWAAAGEDTSARTVRLRTGKNTWLFLQGRAATLADLKPGDHVGVRYTVARDSAPQIRPLHVRATRLP